MNAVELPPIGNPIILAFLRLMNSDAPGALLQEQRMVLRQQLGDWHDACREHFQRCDAQRIDALLVERSEGIEKAKGLIREIRQLHSENGMRSSAQSTLQNNLARAQQGLMDFTPLNRAVSSLEGIEESKGELSKLRTAVAACKQEISDNQRDMLNCAEEIRQLQREYSSWETREAAIVRQVEELQKPPEDRNQKSSVVWEDRGSMFGLQLS